MSIINLALIHFPSNNFFKQKSAVIIATKKKKKRIQNREKNITYHLNLLIASCVKRTRAGQKKPDRKVRDHLHLLGTSSVI